MVWEVSRPGRFGSLTPLIAEYEAFIRPRLDALFAVSRHEVDRRTVRSAHADFLLRATEARNMLVLCPGDVDPLIARTRAGGRLLYLDKVRPQLEHEAELFAHDVPTPRLRCNPLDRSIWLDGKQIAREVERADYAFIALLNASYPNWMTFPAMQELAPDLEGVNQTRLKRHLPRRLAALVRSTRGKGHALKLPKLPS
jgi:hypothetical protein